MFYWVVFIDHFFDDFVDDFDYFLIQIMFQRLWIYNCLLHCNMQYITATEIEFACVTFDKLEEQQKTFT